MSFQPQQSSGSPKGSSRGEVWQGWKWWKPSMVSMVVLAGKNPLWLQPQHQKWKIKPWWCWKKTVHLLFKKKRGPCLGTNRNFKKDVIAFLDRNYPELLSKVFWSLEVEEVTHNWTSSLLKGFWRVQQIVPLATTSTFISRWSNFRRKEFAEKICARLC